MGRKVLVNDELQFDLIKAVGCDEVFFALRSVIEHFACK
jgi:hypothetical protein